MSSIYKGHILAGSPFYVVESGSAGFTCQLSLYVWNGNSGSKPSTANYVLTKKALTNTSTTNVFEISKLIGEDITHSVYAPSASASDLDEFYWLNVVSSGSSSVRDDIYLVTDGYKYFTEGPSLLEDNYACMTTDTIYTYNTQDIRIAVPVINIEPNSETLSVSITAAPSVNVTVGSAVTFTAETSIDVQTYQLTFQWYYDPLDEPTPITGETASTLQITATAEYSYWVVCTSGDTTVLGSPATSNVLTINIV